MNPANSSNPKLSRRTTAALPRATSPPAFVVEAEGFIHVLAAYASSRGAMYVALDRDGAVASPVGTLPISLASAGVCSDEVIATGVHVDKGVRWALGLDAAGAIRWETPLPIPTTGLVWVVATCIAGNPAIVWEVEKDTTGELGIATVRGGSLGLAEAWSQPGVAFGLNVAAIGASVFVLRSHGAAKRADILRIENGAVGARAATVENAQAIAAVGDRLAVLSWTPEALLLQWLDTSLAPLGVPETIATAEPSSWIRFATLHAAGEDRIAISYLVGGGAGELIQMPSGRSEPGEYAHHFLGRYDAALHALADISEVTPTGTAWSAGAWLGDRLLFVHGATAAALSIFELDLGARGFR
jgi:hypothetical protein